ncbi:hypothetical protein Bbelb_230620 [Branchiostoma belcheri]|nr:hypothetical protein Bbelb_230620 [Branchiostoma belcheri]
MAKIPVVLQLDTGEGDGRKPTQRKLMKTIPDDPDDVVSLLINNFHLDPYTWIGVKTETQSVILMRLAERGMVQLVTTAITQTKILKEMMPSAEESIAKSRQFLDDVLRTISTMSTYLPAAKKLGQFFTELLPSFEEVLARTAKQIRKKGEVEKAYRDFPFRALHNILVAATRKDVLQPFCRSKCYDLLLDTLHGTNPVTLYYTYRILHYTVEMGSDKEKNTFKEKGGFKLFEMNARLLRGSDDVGEARRLLFIAELLKVEIKKPGHPSEYFKFLPKPKRLITEGPHVEQGLVCHIAAVPVICSRMDCRKTDSESGKPLKACARCLLARYCSVECQTLHWKNGHKEECFTKEDLLKKVS